MENLQSLPGLYNALWKEGEFMFLFVLVLAHTHILPLAKNVAVLIIERARIVRYFGTMLLDIKWMPSLTRTWIGVQRGRRSEMVQGTIVPRQSIMRILLTLGRRW